MPVRGLIFDFDGVIADSEALANTVLAETVTGLGREISLQYALDHYMGRRWPEVVALIEADIGRKVPDGFSEALKAATLKRFRTDLQEVEGARAFIRQFSWLPQCIASSSSMDRLRVCLEVLGLSRQFGRNVYSAEMVERGKPHPDIFLLAAEGIEVLPRDCAVIEDSASGVRAGIAAGMTVIGLCAGSHLKPGHAQNLAAAGANYVAANWREVQGFVSTLTEAVANSAGE
jgi:HAD superfamily hydrolase (TIGR01509 family)